MKQITIFLLIHMLRGTIYSVFKCLKCITDRIDQKGELSTLKHYDKLGTRA